MLTLKDLSFGVASGCAEYYVFGICLKLCLIEEFRSLEYRACVLSFVSVSAGAGLLHAEFSCLRCSQLHGSRWNYSAHSQPPPLPPHSVADVLEGLRIALV